MKNKIYFSYQTRLITNIVLLIVSIIISILLLANSFNLFDKTEITYDEKNEMTYTVLLKDNSLLEEKEMPSNLNYIASLIDTVKVNYIYEFTPEELIKGTYNYNVTATINIIDQLTGELYYKKDYVLVDSIPEYILKSKLSVNNTIDLDYDYFKDIAYKTLPYYGNNAKANLEISFNVNKDLETEEFKENNINNQVTSNIVIPLTNQETNIKFQSSNYEEKNTLYYLDNYDEKDDNYLLYSIILDVYIVYLIYKLTKLLKALQVKENKYDKKLSYIRRKYNKIIVDVETMPDFTEYKITKITKFNELVDVRNSYKDPIRFFEVAPHSKCHFYIIHKNEIFLYTLKDVDLEKKKD